MKSSAIASRMVFFNDACRLAGLKVTHQRSEIYRELAGSGEHPDARRIYSGVRERIPAISFDTVYRTLHTFEEKGIVRMVGVWGDSQKFDANKEAHHHFVCLDCGAIHDFQDPTIDGLRIPESAYGIGEPEFLHVEVRGRCAACSRKQLEAGGAEIKGSTRSHGRRGQKSKMEVCSVVEL